ncbi:ragulator complex protein LAMTOR3-like isoform X1 [Amphibalanus amphitrite]|uniref:ragulator complex protein LAMTOR3-like isoform X1 n=1 Tax=Amphibalanus amphitrite TaxID=1232801 RepID=UPI001C92B0E4|nr:ragulator complex protein LAMTOR3-like isoform X1 [Amphibalanus amphitrite]
MGIRRSNTSSELTSPARFLVDRNQPDAKKYLENILNGDHGVEGIAIHDKDGCCIVKVSTPACPESAMGVKYLSAFSVLSDQAAKMNMEKNKKIFHMYSKHQVVQFRLDPVILTVVAAASANTGYLSSLDVTLEPLLQRLQPLVRPH